MKATRLILLALFFATALWSGCVDEEPVVWQPPMAAGEGVSKKTAFDFGGAVVTESTPGQPVPIVFDAGVDTGL